MKNFLKVLKYRIKEIKHRYSYRYKNQRMRSAMKRYKECPKELLKPKSQIKRELKLMKKYWKCFPAHYFRYELYKKEKSLSDEELINYIPEFFFYSIFLPQFEEEKYKFLIEEKNLADLYFKNLKIKMPKVLFKIIGNQIFDKNMKNITIEEALKMIETLEIEKLFFKPVNGQGGFGIEIFTFNIKEKKYFTKDGKKLDTGYFKSLKGDFIVQEGLRQKEQINKIYANAINTLRIASENKDGKVKIVCSVLRLGRGGKEVDNICQGGIILGVDKITGSFYDYGITEECDIYNKHPDSQYVFKGEKIENFDEVKEFVRAAAQKIPYFKYLGWDIALTDEGIVAIETNLGFGLDLYQIPLGGLRKNFGIENPNYFWTHLE